jgi:hypothetical protein
VFDGLLPEPYNTTIIRLLFICAQWHGIAKLRMHTDQTLHMLDEITVRLGTEFRAFTEKTCPAFTTRELDREVAARQRRQQAQAKITDKAPNPFTSSNAGGRRNKTFNLHTYKFHSLGDYASTIRRFGSADSYSTEPVSICGHKDKYDPNNYSPRVSSRTVSQRLGTSAPTERISPSK